MLQSTGASDLVDRSSGGPGVAEVIHGLGQQRADPSYALRGLKPEVRRGAPSQGTNQDQDSKNKLRSNQSSNIKTEGLPESKVRMQTKVKPKFKGLGRYTIRETRAKTREVTKAGST